MSHAAIVNPMANLAAPSAPSDQNQDYSLPMLTSAPQMPTLKPAPSVSIPRMSTPSQVTEKVTIDKNVKYDADGKRIKKGELDPATMIHVPGGLSAANIIIVLSSHCVEITTPFLHFR